MSEEVVTPPAAETPPVETPPAAETPPVETPPAAETPPAVETPPAETPPAPTAVDWDTVKQSVMDGIEDDKERASVKTLLDRTGDPSKLVAITRELQRAVSDGGRVKIPGADATDEERAAFYKQINQPDNPEGLVENIKLSDGVILGDLDKPVVDDFAKAVHGATTPQEFVDKTVDWYLQLQDQQIAEMDTQDEANRTATQQELRNTWGDGYQREMNIAEMAFKDAPAVKELLMEARLSDGTVLKDNADAMKWLNHIARQSYEVQTVVQDGEANINTVESEIEEIEKFRRENKSAYFKDEKKQARYRELLGVRERHQQRSAA